MRKPLSFSLPPALRRWVQEPPPEFAFEISELGIALAQPANAGAPGFVPLPPGMVSVSPQKDNVQQPEAFTEQVRALAPAKDTRRKRSAVLILPDYCARVTVLDFDRFPTSPEEQLALVRFRMRKAVPFDVDAATIAYSVQPSAQPRQEVLVTAVSQEIVSHYEAPFRAAGFHPGFVTTSALTALNLLPASGSGNEAQLFAKLSAQALTVVVLQGNTVKLVRCVELAAITPEDALGVLYPTIAYTEDELQSRPQQLLLCGFGNLAAQLAPSLESELGVTVDVVQSRYGTPQEYNAGLLGYLEAA